jgi:hypothetical protein
MQTFLPLPDFMDTARCLDYRRLGKQRVEAMQILNILSGKTQSNAWKNHPAISLWKDNISALKIYCNTMIDEWIRRGYKNTMKKYYIPIDYDSPYPDWFGDNDFHSRHRAALLFKNYEWYTQFNWSEEPKIDYRWS